MNRTELNQLISMLIPQVKLSAINRASTELYKAGFVVGGARGLSAPKVNSQDAINTILGVISVESPVKAAEALPIFRRLEGEKGICCGLPSGTKEPWILGEALEAIISNAGAYDQLEKLVVCRTAPYAEIHWKKNGKPLVMTFGEKPKNLMQVDCILNGAVIGQVGLRLEQGSSGSVNPLTGKCTAFD